MPHHADVLVANRAYGDHNRPPGDDDPIPGAGGLVAAVGSVIQPWDGAGGTLWIGAGRGSHDREFVDERGMEVLNSGRGPLLHQRLFFDDESWAGHYEAVSNSFLWPVLHLVRNDLPGKAAFFPVPQTPNKDDWDAYLRVNAAFASAAADSGRRSIWVHDYQLALAPESLRMAGFDGAVGFFLHTPFPPLEGLRPVVDSAGLEMFAAFVRGILGSTLAGFQTERDRAHFSAAAQELCGARVCDGGVEFEGRRVTLGAFPVGVNADEVTAAIGGEIPETARSAAESGLPLVVGLERADFTKGLPERMAAIERALSQGWRFAYAGAASPTRQGIALYDGFAEVLDAAVERARAAARRAGCPFVHIESSLTWSEVVALLGAADVVFTSSLADGMNLVPLQAVVAQRGRTRRGVMIAGRDAGIAPTFAAFESHGLAIIDPLDIDGSADTLCRAVDGRLAGVSHDFVASVSANDATAWGDRFITELEAAHADS